jgi:hypothetical protein
VTLIYISKMVRVPPVFELLTSRILQTNLTLSSVTSFLAFIDGAHSTRYTPYSPNSGFYYVRYNDRTRYFFEVFYRMGELIMGKFPFCFCVLQLLHRLIDMRYVS